MRASRATLEKHRADFENWFQRDGIPAPVFLSHEDGYKCLTTHGLWAAWLGANDITSLVPVENDTSYFALQSPDGWVDPRSIDISPEKVAVRYPSDQAKIVEIKFTPYIIP